jgi:hypothetical protein
VNRPGPFCGTPRQTQKQADAGYVNGGMVKALESIVNECLSQPKLPEDIPAKG